MPALLVPVHLDARVLTSPQLTPALAGAPFGAEITLGPGVHLHWALPDALTRVRAGDNKRSPQTLRPGIPDRWLVLRFSAPQTRSVLGKSFVTRSWCAWVLESESGKVTALENWTSRPRSDSKVLTAAGLLEPASARLGAAWTGWGASSPKEQTPWPRGHHAYYPSVVNALGLYDKLSDVSDRTQAISYSVIGWCSRSEQDPLASSADRETLLRDLRWSVLSDDSASSLKADGSVACPQRIVCHGSLFGVNLNPAAQAAPSFTVSAHLSLTRALAETVAAKEEHQDTVETMIRGLDLNMQSSADLLDLPYQLHERSFDDRSASPAKAYAQLRLKPSVTPPALDRAALLKYRADQKTLFAQALLAESTLRERVLAAMARLKASRAGQLPVHERLLRVIDDRGRETSHFWVDLHSHSELNGLARKGALGGLELPDTLPVHEVAGPRWRRARAPVVLLQGAGRAFRHGGDGRFASDGTLRCRQTGQTLRALCAERADCPANLAGSRLLMDISKLRDNRALPSETIALAEEALLQDPESASLMAYLHAQTTPLPLLLTQATLATWYRELLNLRLLTRYDQLAAALREASAQQLRYEGSAPSPVGFIGWQQAWSPLFADLEYALAERKSGDPWGVERGDDVATGKVFSRIQERVSLLPAGPRLLHKVLFGNTRVSTSGDRASVSEGPDQVDPDRVLYMDMLSASLNKLEDSLASQRSLYAGDLVVGKVRVIDSFGSLASWSGGATRRLAARPTRWTRLQLRLVDGTRAVHEAAVEADRTRPCVAGFLVPDLVENTLEIFDEQGEALGQLQGDPPVLRALVGSTVEIRDTRSPGAGQTLKSWFVWSPWLTQQSWEGRNPNLRALVESVTSSETPCPSTLSLPSGVSYEVHEAAVSGLIRAIDGARASTRQQRSQSQHSWAMVGRPVALIRASAWVESAEGPSMSAATPPSLGLRLGDLRFPNDGVVGRLEGEKFIVVDPEVKAQAPLNVLPEARQDLSIRGQLAALRGLEEPTLVSAAIQAPFVAGEGQIVPLSGTPKGLLLLVDLGAQIRAVTGALPVKRLTIPPDQVRVALDRLQPSIAVGPVLAEQSLEDKSAGLPSLRLPQIPDMMPSWVEQGHTRMEKPLPQITKDALPKSRVRVTRGWLRFNPREAR